MIGDRPSQQGASSSLTGPGQTVPLRPRPSSRDGDLVNLISRVTGTLVDALDSIGAGTVRKTEDVTSPGVGPRLLECDALVVLYVDVRLVGGFLLNLPLA